MDPYGLFGAENPLFQVPMIWALHRLGLPYNRITRKAEMFFYLAEGMEKIKEKLTEKIMEETPGPILFWDDVPFQFHKPTVWETWALLSWWDFQRWAI